MSFPIKNGGSFHSYVNVYQRVETILTHISIPWVFSWRPRSCQMFRQAIDGTDGPFTVGAPGTRFWDQKISAPWTKYGWCGRKKYGINIQKDCVFLKIMGITWVWHPMTWNKNPEFQGLCRVWKIKSEQFREAKWDVKSSPQSFLLSVCYMAMVLWFFDGLFYLRIF